MNRINIAVWWVKDYETGKRDTLGGLERWTRDLVIELINLGKEVVIFQRSKISFKSDYHGATLIGIQSSKNFTGNFIFYNKLRKYASVNEPIIFISQDLVWGRHFNRSIAVNHGVWWSSRQSKIKRLALEIFNKMYLRNTKMTICVDTNYINWVIESVKDSEKILHKLRYIPNYYDSSQFYPIPRNNKNKITILFPRRIMGLNLDDEPRGAKDCLLAVNEIIKKGNEVEAIFLGEGNLVDELKLLSQKLGLEKYISYSTAHFDEIQEYYKKSEVVIIPSRFSEGTSLSAIEALASNCFVISSCVGGLQNLPLFPPFGLMTEPTPSRIADCIQYYIDNRISLTSNLPDNVVLERFEIKRWKREVVSLIELI